MANQCGNTTAHGYNFTLPAASPGTHTVNVYAVDNGNVTTAQLNGSPGYFTVPQPPRTDLLYGYFSGCGTYASEQQGHINLWWATDCLGTGVWHTEMASSLHAGHAAGATTAVLSLWHPYMVFDQNAAANADSEFRQLVATGELAGFSTIVIYPYDEPEGHVSDQDMTAAIQMLRGVIANIPELSQAKFGVFYNCNATEAARTTRIPDASCPTPKATRM